MNIKITEKEFEELKRLAEHGVDYSSEFSADGLISDSIQFLAGIVSRQCCVERETAKTVELTCRELLDIAIRDGLVSPNSKRPNPHDLSSGDLVGMANHLSDFLATLSTAQHDGSTA